MFGQFCNVNKKELIYPCHDSKYASMICTIVHSGDCLVKGFQESTTRRARVQIVQILTLVIPSLVTKGQAYSSNWSSSDKHYFFSLRHFFASFSKYWQKLFPDLSASAVWLALPVNSVTRTFSKEGGNVCPARQRDVTRHQFSVLCERVGDN